MANEEIQNETSEESTGEQPGGAKKGALDSGTYEIIKKRLVQHGKDLKERLDKLNVSRKEVFGSIENTLLGSERIITVNNCIPRDMAAVGDKFLFGYNVHMGLKTKINLEDVFAVYEYKDRQFKESSFDFLADKRFVTDFTELYKYYKSTFLLKLTVLDPYLYMVFQVGKTTSDIKAFKWLIGEEGLTYVDNRSDHEVKFPPQHDFEWKRARREDHRYGLHPHVSIEDRVFVEAIEGDLTIKVEDNTDSGQGLYAEDVVNKDQTLDDAEIFYSIVGNLILLKIKPYEEPNFRYFVFNEKIQEVYRIDAIKDSCILLPDNHGLIFSNGYYLQSGTYKRFEVALENMVFEQRIPSSNGEDFQYFFYNKETGTYQILSYNLISQSVATPIICNGYSHFENGEMILFKAEEDARKNHVIQIWQTPYVGRDYVQEAVSDSLLYKIGNQDVVRCMSECQAVINLVRKEEGYVNLYVDIEKEASNILDTYFWIDKEETFNMKAALAEIRTTAAAAVEEYEKVTRIKRATRKQIDSIQEKTKKLLREVAYSSFDDINAYVAALAQLRVLRGEIISLKDLRYTNVPLIEKMESEVKEKNEEFSGKCIEFLLLPEGLEPYIVKVDAQFKSVDDVTKGSEGKELDEKITTTSSELELLIEIVSNLKIEDPTKTTEIIDRISTIYASLNQAKSKLNNRMKELQTSEGKAEFNSQMKLIDQAVVNYLGVADSPQKCEEYLTKLMVQIEELEGKFADFEEFIPQLTEKRDELYSAFESKKLAILEKRNKKATALQKAADRILNGLKNRLKSFPTINEINGYFASDLMVEKVRDIVEQLLAIGDTVKADDIQGRIKTVKEDAVRQLKDKQDLFVDGKNIIKFGQHVFTVNEQHLDLSLVQRDGDQYFHMTGTDFWQKVEAPELDELRPVWDQEAVSENRDVYRGEYLVYKLLEESRAGGIETLAELDKKTPEELLEFIQKFMGPRYKEAYTKGIHDADAAAMLKVLITMHQSLDLLIYSPSSRALAAFYWHHGDEETKKRINNRLKGLNQVATYFSGRQNFDNFIMEIREGIETFVTKNGIFCEDTVEDAATYLCSEIMRGDSFVISSEADELYQAFTTSLKMKRADMHFKHSIEALKEDLNGAFYLVQEWILAYFGETEVTENNDFVDEVIALLLLNTYDLKKVIPVKTSKTVEGLHGEHRLIEKGKYHLAYTCFIEKMRTFDREIVPSFHRYQELKKSISEEFKNKLRLEEFKSRVLSSFVRNKLINDVYLPLIGDNLAKQMGAAGEGKRTDLMGLLLLISPPGYGKTTLMEYIANRLGIIFVKVNGPAIGHQVTSLDPAETRNAGAREELKKLNLAFEMGNNIMIYLDDIQHCNPELLQKFISLCDAQRKIEGIYNGVAKTYDLRGKKVAVVMAGNPYTESGEKFQIPDMLSNRADVYNLGDMLRENEEAFTLSYIENSLTSNPVLNNLVTRSKKDIYTLIEIAQGRDREGIEFEGNYSGEEINEFISVIEKLIRVRDVVLISNMEYIRSAARADEYRTEPAFKLQGSYRNMNRIAEKVLPVMNNEELESVIEGSYENDAQTLTSGAESNMLKWKELVGRMDEKSRTRWNEIKNLYGKNKLVKGDDKMGQAILQLNELGEGLSAIKDVISIGFSDQDKEDDGNPHVEMLAGFNKGLENMKEVVAGAIASQPKDETVDERKELLDGLKDIKKVIAQGFKEFSKGTDNIKEAFESALERMPAAPVYMAAPQGVAQTAPVVQGAPVVQTVPAAPVMPVMTGMAPDATMAAPLGTLPSAGATAYAAHKAAKTGKAAPTARPKSAAPGNASPAAK
ncbi:MAG: AAA family ATPase, partial [bacterium]|nr:AAA family ATPase [bacterium]